MENNIIFEGQIFRDSSSRLIIPDDIYDELSKTKTTSSYEFAMQMCKDGHGGASNYNYYASWYILVKNDGGLNKCIKASKVKGAKDSDAIHQMIQSGKMFISQVSINSAEEVFESKIKNIEAPAEDNSEEEYYSFVDKETKSIEAELGDIIGSLSVKSESYYNDIKYRLTELKERSYYLYSKSLGFSYRNESIKLDAEKRYSMLYAKIDSVMGKLEILHDENFSKGIVKGKDYYTFSDAKYPPIIEVKLKELSADLNEYSENDYQKLKSRFNDLYNEVYEIYQLILNSATETDCMTKTLLNEAITKYKRVVEIIGKEEARLEYLHSQNGNPFT